MAETLSRDSIACIRRSVPLLEQQGLPVALRLYELLFESAEIRALFNHSHQGPNGTQPRALAAALLAFARSIDDPSVMGRALERIAHKHVAMAVRPEHYALVGRALLAAMREVLGAEATPHLVQSWNEAYWFLAEILMKRERTLYSEQRLARGGWNGWRDFRIVGKVSESTVAASLTLEPVDGGPVMRHRPGQYLTCRIAVPGHSPLTRNYSISSVPSDFFYRVTIKREPGGIVSNWAHDTAQPGLVLQVAAPSGAFFLPPDQGRPVVMVSGGIGQTPMISMLFGILSQKFALPIHFIHAARNGGMHALREEVRIMAGSHPNLTVTTFYSRPDADDRLGLDYHHAGPITADYLATSTPVAEADYFLCGPRPFLRALLRGLGRAGVPDAHVHYEFFTSADEYAVS